ncbi:mechanosensitive ion channel family protein, partial [Myxococcus sp. AM011]|nr:mechanosensitive ion channel family protein [Myxococcus sp. AM011]
MVRSSTLLSLLSAAPTEAAAGTAPPLPVPVPEGSWGGLELWQWAGLGVL